MELIDKRVYTGRNIYSHKLCMRLTVDIEGFEEIPTKDISNFNERLLRLMPGLSQHKCSVGYVGGFCERLKEGTYLPHVFEHMLIEMQNLLGFTDIKYGKARLLKDSVYYIVIQYEMEEAALAVVDIGIEMINNLISGKEFELNGTMLDLEKRLSLKRIGPSTRSICDEALRRGIPILKIGKDSIFQLGYGKYQKRIEATLTNKTSCLGVDISCDKELTRELLRNNNLPIAEGFVGDNIINVLKICKKLSYPLVIKPVNGSKGRGVTVNILNENEAITAYHEAARLNSRVIVEKYIQGEDYRILVVDGKAIAAARRIPPTVCGDGIHSLKELIDIENENPLRGHDHEKPLTKILVDDIMINYLNKKNLSLTYIPLKDEKVILRFNANLSTGGEAIDCTDILNKENAELAVKAARLIGLDVAGIDICMADIRDSIIDSGGAILEVNAAPGIRMHIKPTVGKSRNVAANILDYLFEGDKSSIPVVAVTGTNGKTTVTRMIAHIMKVAGLKTGMATTGGVYIGNKLVLRGDTTGSESARMVLMDYSIEGAVLETARGGIIRSGLGYDRADVGVITNISEDHLGLDGIDTLEQLVEVKSLVAEAVKETGYVVLNAEDESSKKIKTRINSKCIYFSKHLDNETIKNHLNDNGIAVFIEEGYMVISSAGKTHKLIKTQNIPCTLDGLLVYNLENAMAAAAACYGIGLEPKYISIGLGTFNNDALDNPGRFNIYNIKGVKVIVDYGHNIEAYKAVIKSLKKLDSKKLIGIIGVPGDRSNDSIIKLGGISSSGFDYIYIKEDMDKRGREVGEVAKLLEVGVTSTGMNKQNYEIIENEGHALEKALNKADIGDTIIVFYENYKLIVDTVKAFLTKMMDNNEEKDVV